MASAHARQENEGADPLALAPLRHALQEAFGARPPSGLSALDVLVLGLAGAAGQGGERAAEALKRGFRPWTKLLDAAPELVAAALRPVEPDLGRALDRGETLIRMMRRLAMRSGGLSLAFLAEMKAAEAWAWLEDSLGLKPPLIARVLSAKPISHRVAWPDPPALRAMERLGLIPSGAGPVAAGRALAQAAPAAWTGADLIALSGLLRALGNELCHEAAPDCGACPLPAACPSATTKGASFPRRRGVRPMAYLRRRIARMQGGGLSSPQAGLRLGGEAFSEAVLPHGLLCGVHQAAGATPLQGSAPLILAIAAVAALERRDREGRARESPPGLMPRAGSRPKPGAPERATSPIRLLMVQEVDAVREHGEPYAPGLLALGVDPASIAFVAAGSGAEVLRVIEEALKLGAAPVLVAELRRGEAVADLAVTRRLNLAARRAESFLLLITPDFSNTSAALTRWRVASAPSRLAPNRAFSAFAARSRIGAPAFALDLVRNRLGATGAWTVEWDLHEQRFRTLPSRAVRAQPALPAPHLPPPVDRPAVDHGPWRDVAA